MSTRRHLRMVSLNGASHLCLPRARSRGVDSANCLNHTRFTATATQGPVSTGLRRYLQSAEVQVARQHHVRGSGGDGRNVARALQVVGIATMSPGYLIEVAPCLQVFRRVQRTNVNIGIRRHGIGALLHPLDGFFDGLDLPQPETRDHFLRFL